MASDVTITRDHKNQTALSNAQMDGLFENINLDENDLTWSGLIEI